jgi:hypothetical protein
MAAGWALPVLAFALVASPSAGPLAAGDAPLFPQPFVVEHQVTQTLPDGDVFTTDPVTDYYTGSRIISVRADGSRLVVDLAQHELTEIRPERGSYSVLSFERFASLSRSLRTARRAAAASATAAPPAAPAVTVSEVTAGTEKAATAAPADPLLARAGVRHLLATATRPGATRPAVAMDVWLDPTIHLSPSALAAIESFEGVLSDPAANGGVSFSRLTAAARKSGAGALPFRTSRPLVTDQDGAAAGRLDDVALRVEILPEVPPELLDLPEGLTRVAHPLEVMAAGAADEAELRQIMGGEK